MQNKKGLKHKQVGATLVELILSIVIISTALAGVLGVINITVLHSADPIVQQQAIAIAESYIEEITALPVVDPDLTGVVDQDGNVVTALANYNVRVTIANQTINGIANMREITVTVERPSVLNINLVAYKAP